MADDLAYPGMRQLAERLFAETPSSGHQELAASLMQFVQQAVLQNVAEKMDWSKENLTTLNAKFGTSKRKQSAVPQPSSKKQKQSTNNNNRNTTNNVSSNPMQSSKADAIKARQARFSAGGVSGGVDNSSSSSNGTKNSNGSSSNSFTNTITASPYVDKPLTTPIVGTSTALEKPYFRLTGQVNPAVVRPPEVLQRSFGTVLRKYMNNGQDYSYVSEQLQSIRQDLTVQHCENWIAQQVYEVNAQLALRHDDIGEFNKCLTRVMSMYDEKVDKRSRKTRWEFYAYYTYYLIILQRWSSVSQRFLLTPQGVSYSTEDVLIPQPSNAVDPRLAEPTAKLSKEDQNKMYFRALYVAECVQAKDNYGLERAAKAALPLEQKLIKIILDRERVGGLYAITTALQPNNQIISVEDVGNLMGADMGEELAQNGVPVTEGAINCGTAQPRFAAAKHRLDAMFDIKGQK